MDFFKQTLCQKHMCLSLSDKLTLFFKNNIHLEKKRSIHTNSISLFFKIVLYDINYCADC